MDPQGNTTSGFGVDKNGIENTLYELLLDVYKRQFESTGGRTVY